MEYGEIGLEQIQNLKQKGRNWNAYAWNAIHSNNIKKDADNRQNEAAKTGFYQLLCFLILSVINVSMLSTPTDQLIKDIQNTIQHARASHFGRKQEPSLLTCFKSKRLTAFTFLCGDPLQELLCKMVLLFYFYLCFSLCILKTWRLSTYHNHLKENEVSRYCQNSNGKHSLYKVSLKLVEQCMYLVVMGSH